MIPIVTSNKTTDEMIVTSFKNGKEEAMRLSDMNLFYSTWFSNVYRGTAKLKDNVKMNVVIVKTWPNTKKELRVLKTISKETHRNIVNPLFHYQKSHEGRMCLGYIFEYIPLTIYSYSKQQQRKIDILDVKLIVFQLFRGQAYLQKLQITHRDIQPSSLLFEPDTGVLKIGDFGASTDQPSSVLKGSYGVNRYYRPPELVFGSRCYGPEVDIWSCGCVFGALLRGKTLLLGTSNENQGHQILDMIGMPTEEEMKEMNVDREKFDELLATYTPDPTKCTGNMTFLLDRGSLNHENQKIRVQNDIIPWPDMKSSVILLRKILRYDPKNRYSGAEFCLDPYFKELFNNSTKRLNGRTVDCIYGKDLNDLKNSDGSVTEDNKEESY